MLRPLIRSAAYALALAAGGLLGAVVLITVANVGGFVLNTVVRPFGYSVSGLPGYEDAASILVGIAALFILPYCQLMRGHVSVDLFTSFLSSRGLKRLGRATDTAMALLAGFLAAMMTSGMLSYKADGVRTPVLDWPVWPFMLPGIVALALWALTALMLAIDPAAAGAGKADAQGGPS
ncbi:MAG: TRAP transporter small permease [Rhodospirillales bacterium]|nr:TRAP transporter small permease [Rhodospirillales bacterium]